MDVLRYGSIIKIWFYTGDSKETAIEINEEKKVGKAREVIEIISKILRYREVKKRILRLKNIIIIMKQIIRK